MMSLIIGLSGAAAVSASPASLTSAYSADPEVSKVDVAPDGHAVSFLENLNGKVILNILPKGENAPFRVSTGARDVSKVRWMDSSHVEIDTQLLIEASSITPRQRVTQIMSYNVKNNSSVIVLGKTQDTVPMAAGGNIAYGMYDGHPSIFLRGLARGPTFSLYAADEDTGRGKVLQAGSFDAEDWIVTPTGRVVAEKKLENGGPWSGLWMSGERVHQPVVLPHPEKPFDLAGLGRASDDVLIWQAGDLYEISAADVVSPALQPAGRRVIGLYHDHPTGRLVAIDLGDGDLVCYDTALDDAWKAAQKAFPTKNVTLINFDDSRTELIVRTEGADDAGSIYWVHLADHKAELLREERPALDQTLGAVAFYPFYTHDGRSMTAIVTTPRKRPAQGLAAIALTEPSLSSPGHVHFELLAQALAAQGYAVVQLNGSAVASDEYDNPLIRQPGKIDSEETGSEAFGGRQQSSLSEAVAFLGAQGVIDIKKVCVEGAGYGAYVALQSIMASGSTFRCAIGIKPIVDLETEITYPEPNTRGGGYDSATSWRSALGKRNLSGAALRDLSPLYHADRAAGPILLIDEPMDMSLVAHEPERMRDALKRGHKPVTLLSFDPKSEDLNVETGKEKMLAAVYTFLAVANPPN